MNKLKVRGIKISYRIASYRPLYMPRDPAFAAYRFRTYMPTNPDRYRGRRSKRFFAIRGSHLISRFPRYIRERTWWVGEKGEVIKDSPANHPDYVSNQPTTAEMDAALRGIGI
jgi:hypothetical protein